MKDALAFVNMVIEKVPHCRVIGLRGLDASPQQVTIELPYNADLIGNPETGIIHGGALTTLMDTACGLSVQMALEHLEICPTLDLRIDYMTSAQPQQPVFGRATVYRVTDNVVFSRGIAYQGKEERVIAHCVATFMRLPPPCA